jgi:hypothetical protein
MILLRCGEKSPLKNTPFSGWFIASALNHLDHLDQHR